MSRAVIIGSGAGGLCAAILLAERGWDVTVIEQHYRAGGCLHRFFREGIGFDTGFHYVGSVGPDQSFGKVLRHLGIAEHLRFNELDPDGFDVLRFPDLEFRVPAGLDRWAARLVAAFPHEAAGVARYLELHKRAISAYALYTLTPGVPVESVVPWEERTLGDVLADCFTDPRIRAVIAGHGAPLYGVAPAEAPFGVHAVVTDHFLGGAWTVEGGGDRLAQVMVSRLKALGGRIRLRKRVDAIQVEGGAATAVIAGTETFPADLVIANLHPKAVLALLPPGSTRPVYQDRVLAARPGRAHFGLYLRVRGDLSELTHRNVYRFRNWDIDAMARAVGDDVPFYFVTAPGARGEGEGVVLAMFLTEWERWAPFAAEAAGRRPGGLPVRSAAYAQVKGAMQERALAALREDWPDWEILSVEASTPLTMEHFTRVPSGATYGHHHAVDQMGRYRLPMLTRVKQLVQVGQAVAMPGVCGAMMSAYAAIGGLVGHDRLIEELRRA